MFLLMLATVLWGTAAEQSPSGYVARDLSRTDSKFLRAQIMSTEKLLNGENRVNGLIDTATKRGISVICRNEESGVPSISYYQFQESLDIIREIDYLTPAPFTPKSKQQILGGLLCICHAQIHLAELWGEFARRKVETHTAWSKCAHNLQDCTGVTGGICQRNHAERAQKYQDQIKVYQGRIDGLLISLDKLCSALASLKRRDAK